AEDGIRDPLVTGVQTCALPIYRDDHLRARRALALRQLLLEPRAIGGRQDAGVIVDPCGGRRRQREYQDQRDAEQQPRTSLWAPRSEERRVGKECRSRWAREQTK